jgi:hypothetical protein
LNELYHPAWQAWVDGKATEIYPTNVAMRGILVPPGATTVELRYVPFMVSWYGLALFALGFLLAGLGWWGLRRWTRPDGPRPAREPGAPKNEHPANRREVGTPMTVASGDGTRRGLAELETSKPDGSEPDDPKRAVALPHSR